MLRRAILFITVLLLSFSAFTQTELAGLQESKDYLNCRLSYFAIKEKITGDASLQIKFDSIKLDLEDIQIERTLTYSELKKLLERNFSKALIKLSEPINKIDIQPLTRLSNREAANALTDTVFQQLKNAYPNEFDKILSQKSILSEKIINHLSATSTNNNDDDKIIAGIIEDSSKQSNIRLVENKQAVKNSFFSPSNFNFWTLLLLLLFLFSFILLAKKISVLNSRIEKRKKEINLLEDKLVYGNDFKKGNEFSIGDIDKRINSNDRIANIEERIRFIMGKIDAFEVGGQRISNTSKPLVEVLKSNDNDVNIFYMSAPSNNYFSITAKSLTKENTVYKFTLSPNKNEASFEIHLMGGVPVSEIAKRRESYLKPACDEENIPPINTKSIHTKRPGLAKLEGDKWLIIIKATIRYE